MTVDKDKSDDTIHFSNSFRNFSFLSCCVNTRSLTTLTDNNSFGCVVPEKKPCIVQCRCSVPFTPLKLNMRGQDRHLNLTLLPFLTFKKLLHILERRWRFFEGVSAACELFVQYKSIFCFFCACLLRLCSLATRERKEIHYSLEVGGDTPLYCKVHFGCMFALYCTVEQAAKYCTQYSELWRSRHL